ncbi:MAG: hypothetical protein M3R00_00205 [Pseudomonadota bacterium]|nr:hypothetical protein [Pseudomonadota bacterium]
MSNERNEQDAIVGSGQKKAAIHALSASVVEFVSRLLIEKAFFQNSNIPHQSLLYLANDLIRTLCPEQKLKFSVAKEIGITYKQLCGQSLTEEEEKYEYAETQLDVVGEVLNGIKYSTMALLGKSLCDSVYSTVQQGLWTHVPAVAGYAGALLFGPQAITAAVDNVLFYSGLRSEQKELIRPWLNTVGRLALGFIPKVHANETGVHYHYPSVSGHTETHSGNESVSMYGENITIKRPGEFNTPEGAFAAEYQLQFKLQQINQLSEHAIRIQVVNQSGEKIPVEFHLKQGNHGPEIQVKSSDSQLQAHWSSYFRVPAGLISAKPEENYAELVSVSKHDAPHKHMSNFISAFSRNFDGQQTGKLLTLALAVVISRQTNNKILPGMLLASSFSTEAAGHRIPDSVFQEHKTKQKALNELREDMIEMFEDLGTISGAIPHPLVSIPLGMANSRLKKSVDSFLKQDPKTTILRRALAKEFEDIRARYGNGKRDVTVPNKLQSKLKATQHILEILNDPRIDIDDVNHQLPTIVEYLKFQQDSTELLSTSYNTLSIDLQEQGRKISTQGQKLNKQGQIIADQGKILTKVSENLQGLAHSSAQTAHRIGKVTEKLNQVQKQGKLTAGDIKNLQADLALLQDDVNDQHIQNNEKFGNIADNQESLNVINQFLFNEAVAVNTAGFEANHEIMKLQGELQNAQTHKDTQAIIAKNFALKNAIKKEQARAFDVERKLNTLGDGFALVAIGAQFLGNPKLAHQISTVGNAAVTIGKSIATLVGVGAAAAASGPLAPVVAIAGALLSVFSLLADNGPTPDEIIIQQLDKLQQQLQTVRAEMHDRFDNVEKMLVAHHQFTKAAFKGLADMLDGLQKVMGHRFDHIEKMLIGIHKDMLSRFMDVQINAHSIYTIAKSIKSQLDIVELAMANGFTTLYHQSYLQPLRAALDYHSTPNVPAMGYETLNEYYSIIKNFASQDSTNALFSGDAVAYRDEDVVRCLPKGIENCINTFASYANVNFKIGQHANLPNPEVFAEATSNLLEFVLNMPEFDINARINDFDEVIRTGNNFVAFVKSLKTNEVLANGLLHNYREAINSVKYALVDVLTDLQRKSNRAQLEEEIQQTVQAVLPPNIATKADEVFADALSAGMINSVYTAFSSHMATLDNILESTRSNAEKTKNLRAAVSVLTGTAIYDEAKITQGQSCNKNIRVLGRLTSFVAACYRWWLGGDNCGQVVPAMHAANKVIEDIRVVEGMSHSLVTSARDLHSPIADRGVTSGREHHNSLNIVVAKVHQVKNSAGELRSLANKAREIYDKKVQLIDFLEEYLRHHVDSDQLADFNRRLIKDAQTEGSGFHNALNRLRLAHGVLIAYLSLGFNDDMQTSYTLQSNLQRLSMPLSQILNEFKSGNRDDFLYMYIQSKLIPEFDALVELVSEKVLESKELQNRQQLNSGYRVVERSLMDISFFKAAYSSKAKPPNSANSNNEDFTCTGESCSNNRNARGAK